MYQNRRGEVMRDIRDEGMGVAAKLYGATIDASGKQFLSSGARTLSSGQLRFHTDRCDVVGLLCVRQASEGGVSKLASSATVYNEILKRRPDLHALLCKPIPRSRFGEEAGGEHVVYDLPVFGVRDGKLTSHFSLTYIENAQMLPSVRKLTDAEHEAIQMLMDVAEEVCFEMRFAPGDMQLLNNHVIYHGRTAFKDDARTGEDRLLMRLWLSVPNSRALPEDHADPLGRCWRWQAAWRYRAARHGDRRLKTSAMRLGLLALWLSVLAGSASAASDYGNCDVSGAARIGQTRDCGSGSIVGATSIARAGMVEWRLAGYDQRWFRVLHGRQYGLPCRTWIG